MIFTWTNLFLLLLAAWIAGSIASRYGYPSVLGELTAGIVLGPPLLGVIASDEVTAILGRLGVFMMMLYVGTQVHPRELLQASKVAWWPAFVGFVLPFVAGYFISIAFGSPTNGALIVGTVMATTSLASLSRVIVDLNLLRTRLGETLMAIALFSLILILIAFSAVLGVVETGSVQINEILLVLGKALLFLLIAVGIGRYGFPILGKLHARTSHMPGRTSELTFAILIGMSFVILAEALGLSFILGAFLAGLFICPGMFQEGTFPNILGVVRDVALGFLAPVFYVSAGFYVSFTVFRDNLLLLVSIIVVALLTKFLGGFVMYLLEGRSWREALIVGLGMNAHGTVDIIMAGVGLELGLITQDFYTALIVMIFVSTLLVPAVLKPGSDWLRRRGELIEIEETEQQPRLEEVKTPQVIT